MLRFLRSEDGSLPLAMLSVLIVTGLTAVAISTMVMGQLQVRGDQAFEHALQTADSGMGRMVTLIETRTQEASFCMGTPPATLPGYQAICTVSNTVTAPPGYSGQAIRDDAADEWTLTVRGTVGGRIRTLQASVPMGSPFTDAAVGRQTIELQGGNRADSFRSGIFSNGSPRTFSHRPYSEYLNTDNSVKDPTKQGFFVTEGPLNLNGQSFSQSDGAKIWYTKNPGYLGSNYVLDPLPGATGICESVTATCEGYYEARDATQPFGDGNRRLEYYRDRKTMPPLRVPTQPTLHFDGDGKTLVALSQSDPAHGKLAGQPYVFRSAKLYSSTVLTGTAVDPVVIYLTGELTAPAHARINFEADPANPSLLRPRPSPSLLVYSSLVGNAVQFATGVGISGGVYAPYGTFTGGSQGDIYGALTADRIRTMGGWGFHYDEAMAEIRGQDWRAVDWVEVGG